MSIFPEDEDLSDDERYSDKTFTFTVTVTCQRQAQAEKVMRERIFHEEDYGFNYTVDFRNFDWKREALREAVREARAAADGDSNDAEIAAWQSVGDILESEVIGEVNKCPHCGSYDYAIPRSDADYFECNACKHRDFFSPKPLGMHERLP